MKKTSVISLAACLAVCLTAAARTGSLTGLADALAGSGPYSSKCSYEVLLASLSEPVTYNVKLQSTPAPSDTLSPCDYLIEWSLPTPSGDVSGFSAYFDGSHFRFRDKRLQEYHASDDVTPFAPGGNYSGGVQQQVQFADLLPQFLAQKFRTMAADSTYICKVTTDTIYNGTAATVLRGVRRIAGYDCMEFTYVFDNKTLHPVHYDLETNPGQIGEQSIAVNYSPCEPMLAKIDLTSLIELESEAFEKYRESTFSLDNLPGRPMPEIQAPTITGERYFHAAGSPFAAPTVIAFVESGVGSTADVIKDIRSAEVLSSTLFNVVWAFLDHKADDVEELTGPATTEETILIHSGGAARDAGVGSTPPVIVFVNSDGTVCDFIRGYNRNLSSIVLEKVTLCK